MTNKELQEILKQYPDDAEVWITDRKNDMLEIASPDESQFGYEVDIVPYDKEINGILIFIEGCIEW